MHRCIIFDTEIILREIIYMYTRCPSCRAEISFEPPRNLANLPQGYKHRIRCPNCGVTISVKIPNTAVVASPAPTYSYENPNQQGYSDIQVGVGTPQTGAEQKAVEKSAKNAQKRKSYGRGKAAVMFIISLLFIAAAAIAYLHTSGTTVPVIGDYVSWFNPIKVFELLIKDASGFIDTIKNSFADGIMNAIAGLVVLFSSVIVFIGAGLTAITNLLVLIIGKYNGAAKAFGVIFALFMFAFAAASFVICGFVEGGYYPGEVGFLAYLKAIIANKDYIIYAIVGLTFLNFLLACIFTGKTKKEKEIKGIVDEDDD